MKHLFLLTIGVLIATLSFGQTTPVFVSGDTIHCNAGNTSILEVNSPDAISYQWYMEVAGLPVLLPGETADTLLTLPLVTTTVFLVEAVTALGTSDRLSITVNVVPNIDVLTIDPPTADFCNGDTVTLTGNSTLGTTEFYRWFEGPNTVAWIASGQVFEAGPLTTDTIFYLEGFNEFGCGTDVRFTVLLTERIIAGAASVDPAISTICKGDSVELVASPVTPNVVDYLWYTQPNGGTPIFDRDTFNTGPLSASQSYFVSGVDADGCETPVRASAQVILNTYVDAVQVEQVEGGEDPCAADTFVFAATSTTGESILFRWYESIDTADHIFEGDTFVTPPLQTTTMYFVAGVNADGCETLIRTPAAAVLNPNLDLATVDPPLVNFCGIDSFEFVATSTLNTDSTFRWYDAATQGNVLEEADTFRTGPVAQTTLYYVAAVDSNNCESVRTPVTVAKLFNLDLVALEIETEDGLCFGEDVLLMASTTIGTSTSYNWYFEEDGFFPVHTGDTFTIRLDSVVTVYVEGVDENGCTTPTRTEATFNPQMNPTIVAIDNDTLLCSDGTATLSATVSNGTVNWYGSANQDRNNPDFVGSPYVINNILADTMVYVLGRTTEGCSSDLDSILVTVDSVESITFTPNPAEVCSGDDLTINLMIDNVGGDFDWYDNPSGGVSTFTGASRNITNITADTTFFVEYTTAIGCVSPIRTTVNITVRQDSIPASSISGDGEICSGEIATLTGSNAVAGVSFAWLTAIDGDTITTNPTLVTDPLFSDTTFWLRAEGSSGCLPSRTPFTVRVSERPNANDITITGDSVICNGNRLELMATHPTAQDFIWERELPLPAGVVSMDATLIIDPLEDTTIVYVRAVSDAGCESDSVRRTLIPLPLPETPNVDSNYISCDGAPVTIDLTASGAVTHTWIENGVEVFNGNRFTTPVITADRTYQVVAIDGNDCSSDTATFIITLETVTLVDSVSGDLSICTDEMATLQIENVAAGHTYTWFDEATGGTQVASGSSFTTGPINSDTAFFVQASTTNCEGASRFRVDVAVNAFLAQPSITGPDLICATDTFSLMGSHPSMDVRYDWYRDAALSDSLTSGMTIEVAGFIDGDSLFLLVTNSSGCMSEFPEGYEVTAIDTLGSSTVQGDTMACPGDPVNLSVVYEDSRLPILTQWVIAAAGTMDTIEVLDGMLSFTAADTAIITAQGLSGSCASATGNAILTVPPSGMLSAPNMRCNASQSATQIVFEWEAVPGAQSYEVSSNGITWSPVAGLSFTLPLQTCGSSATRIVRAINDPNINPCFDTEGMASVSRTCATSDCEPIPPIVVPPMFSPNGDNENDFLFIEGLSPKRTATVQVFDRWGMLVFETNNYDNVTSRLQDPDLEETAYYYLLTDNMNGETSNGYFMVLK